MKRLLLSFLCAGSFALSCVASAQNAELEIRAGDSLAIVGIPGGEHMQWRNPWQARFDQRFSREQVTVRKWASVGLEEATEAALESRADVVLIFVNQREMAAGAGTLTAFAEGLDRCLVLLLQSRPRGAKSFVAPRLALVTPLAAQAGEGLSAERCQEINGNLALYVEALKSVAAVRGILVADLFSPTLGLSEPDSALEKLELSAAEAVHVARMLDLALFGEPGVQSTDDRPPQPDAVVSNLPNRSRESSEQ